jgi:lysophospholipase L1-like esterase
MRVLVFGASVTQGFWDTKGGWVHRLWTHYTELRINDWAKDQPTIFNLGISGDSSREVLKRVENEIISRKWPGENFCFIFSIGINDSFIKGNGEENMSVDEFRENYDKIIAIAKKYSSKIMLLGLQHCDEKRTNPVSWTDISYRNERIKLFDQQIKELAQQQDLMYLPIYEKLKKHHNNGQDIYQDGLHPNDAGHQLVFELVRPALDRLINT